jgi:hypothetical protein
MLQRRELGDAAAGSSALLHIVEHILPYPVDRDEALCANHDVFRC